MEPGFGAIREAAACRRPDPHRHRDHRGPGCVLRVARQQLVERMTLHDGTPSLELEAIAPLQEKSRSGLSSTRLCSRYLLHLTCSPLGRILRLFRELGTPPAGGSRKRCASTTVKAHGTRTPATATKAVFSFSRPPGSASEAEAMLTTRIHANRFTAPSWFGDETADRGASGAQLGRAA